MLSTKLTLKEWPKTFNILTKRRNFAKSGHSERVTKFARRKRANF